MDVLGKWTPLLAGWNVAKSVCLEYDSNLCKMTVRDYQELLLPWNEAGAMAQ